jgi:hypothetical protein
MCGLKGKSLWSVLLLILLFVGVLIIVFSGPPELSGIQTSLVGSGGGIVLDGDNVIFDTVLNDPSPDISYDDTTGEFTITEPGNYYVSWWFAADGAGLSTTVSFAVEVGGAVYSTASSPVVSGELSGDALVTVTTNPTVISLANVTGEDAFIGATPVQANMVIMELIA